MFQRPILDWLSEVGRVGLLRLHPKGPLAPTSTDRSLRPSTGIERTCLDREASARSRSCRFLQSRELTVLLGRARMDAADPSKLEDFVNHAIQVVPHFAVLHSN